MRSWLCPTALCSALGLRGHRVAPLSPLAVFGGRWGTSPICRTMAGGVAEHEGAVCPFMLSRATVTIPVLHLHVLPCFLGLCPRTPTLPTSLCPPSHPTGAADSSEEAGVIGQRDGNHYPCPSRWLGPSLATDEEKLPLSWLCWALLLPGALTPLPAPPCPCLLNRAAPRPH